MQNNCQPVLSQSSTMNQAPPDTAKLILPTFFPAPVVFVTVISPYKSNPCIRIRSAGIPDLSEDLNAAQTETSFPQESSRSGSARVVSITSSSQLQMMADGNWQAFFLISPLVATSSSLRSPTIAMTKGNPEILSSGLRPPSSS